MKVASPHQTPSANPKPRTGVDEKVAFEDEALQSRYLGSIPFDHWSPFYGFGGYHHCPGGLGWGRSIYRDTPIYEPDGKPRVDVKNEQVKANPYSVPLFGALGAAGGGAVGAGIGALVAHFSGLPSAVTTGALGLLGGVAGGVGLAHYAAGDRVRLEWREFSINEKQLDGFYEFVSPHYDTECHTVNDGDGKSHQECRQVQHGYDHSYSPDVRYWQVGSYVGPQVVHYQASSGEWKPETPKTDDTDKPIEGPPPSKPTPPTPPTTPPADAEGSSDPGQQKKS